VCTVRLDTGWNHKIAEHVSYSVPLCKQLQKGQSMSAQPFALQPKVRRGEGGELGMLQMESWRASSSIHLIDAMWPPWSCLRLIRCSGDVADQAECFAVLA
jgi:hypothetical protein